MRVFEESFLVENSVLDWPWARLDLSSDALPRFMSQENSGAISSTITRSRRATGATKSYRVSCRPWPDSRNCRSPGCYFDHHTRDLKLYSHPEPTGCHGCRDAWIHPQRRSIRSLLSKGGRFPADRNALRFTVGSFSYFDDWSGIANDRKTEMVAPVRDCAALALADLQLHLLLPRWETFQQ